MRLRVFHRHGRGIQAIGVFLTAFGIVLIILALWPMHDNLTRIGRGIVLPRGSADLRLLAAAATLSGGIFLVILGAYLKSVEHAVMTLLKSFGNREQATAAPSWSDLLAVCQAAVRRLDSCEAEARRAILDAHRLQERRIDELTAAHNDLATHHRFTKKMLQSLRSEDVFDTLLEGVREGFGFSGAILGLRDRDGDIVFRGAGDLDGRSSVRVPCWDEGSIIARTHWSGSGVLIPTIRELNHRFEDRVVVGEGPAFLIPVTRKKPLPRSEAQGCGSGECPLFSGGSANRDGGNEAGAKIVSRDRRKVCMRCEAFAVSALLIVRARANSRLFTPEAIRSVTTLADEASLALEIVALYENARRLSITDSLTGLINHREFFQTLRRELERARRYQHNVSLLMIDVDDFKKYNDRYGHFEGDRALKRIADLLRTCARTTDAVARYGGEEFGVILPESTPGGALMLAERIKTEIARCDFDPEAPGGAHLTVSVGIYSAEGGAVSEDRVVRFADEAAYLAKHSGKNRVVVKAHA